MLSIDLNMDFNIKIPQYNMFIDLLIFKRYASVKSH